MSEQPLNSDGFSSLSALHTVPKNKFHTETTQTLAFTQWL